MFSSLSRCEAYAFYCVSVTLEMEFALSADQIVDKILGEIVNVWVLLQCRPLNLNGAIISRTFTYGSSTEYMLVGARLLRGNAVSVHQARVTHARIQNRWLAFSPPMEKLVLVPNTAHATMPAIKQSVIDSLERFARGRISGFVDTQCAHAKFEATIHLDDASAAYVASGAQALLGYFNATNTSFASLAKAVQSVDLTVDQSDDEGGWDLTETRIRDTLPSRVLLADPTDVATAYIGKLLYIPHEESLSYSQKTHSTQ